VTDATAIAVFGFLLAVELATGQPRAGVPAGATVLQRGADAIHALGVPGVLIEAVVDGKRTAARSGVAELESNAPLAPSAHFHIASNTKVFVATVTLQLVGEGKLSLEDTVEKWLPGFVTGNGNDGSRITIRNLLQHSSGLVDYNADLPVKNAAEWERERLRTYEPQELVKLAMRHPPLWFPEPHEQRFSYANTNFVLVGMIIERVTGHSWEREVQVRIVRRLRLRNTMAPGTSAAMPDTYVHTYFRFAVDGPFVDTTFFNPTVVGASGALISTTADLNAFLRALLGGKLLSAAQMSEMQQTIEAKQLQELYPGLRYGLGLMWRPLKCGGGYWNHTGNGISGATRNGVTSDGRRSVVVYMSAELHEPQVWPRQEKAAYDLIEQMLCGKL
jgi:D-alanyl-D-alanine carboxypeptidase